MEKNLLLTYTVLNAAYQSGLLRFLKGTAAGDANLDIDNPQDSGVPIPATMADPVIFSYAYEGNVRFLIGEITTTPGTVPSSSCVYSMVEAPNPPDSAWSVLADRITLRYGSGSAPAAVATNPHGVACVGNFLYIINYDDQSIYQLGTNALNGLETDSSYTLPNAPFNVGTAANLPEDARGQAIIALTDGGQTSIFALYIANTQDGTSYEPSVLVKLSVGSNGVLTYVGHVTVGKNAQAIIPIKDRQGKVFLLIPAIGGEQTGGETNGGNSKLHCIPAFADFPNGGEPDPILTGDDNITSPTTYDFRMAAAAFIDNGKVFILTGYYNSTAFTGFDWTLFRADANRLASITAPMTISQAEESDYLKQIDHDTSSPGYFWDILLENTALGVPGQRLWFLQGSPILATLADNYSSPSAPGDSHKLYPTGTDDGQIGGQNVNSADLTAETVRQAMMGASLKRSLKGVAPKTTAAAKAAARSVSVEEEEEK